MAVVIISQNLFSTFGPIVFLGRFAGLLPIFVRKQEGNYVMGFSLLSAVYGCAIALSLAVTAFLGVFRDLQLSEVRSIRMKDTLARCITCSDIFIVIFIIVVAILGAIYHVTKLLKIFERFKQIELIMPTGGEHVKRFKRKTLRITATVVVCFMLLLLFDLYYWSEKSSNAGDSVTFLVKNYLPFYCSYFIIIVFECKFLHFCLEIHRRIKVLNRMLRFNNHVGSTVFLTTTSSKQSVLMHESKGILNMMKVYENITKIVEYVNDTYGFIIMVVLFSCVLHLIVTSYFLLTEITNNNQNSLALSIHVIWIFAHILRLLIIVEPCYMCGNEAKKTTKLVSCLWTHNCNENQLRLFYVMTTEKPISFTACDLVKIDRYLITSIFTAVTTYLVILFQFKTTNMKSEKQSY